MAFDVLVTFSVDNIGSRGRSSQSPIEYNGTEYSTFVSWGEFVLAPVLQSAAGASLGFFYPAGNVVLVVPYNPIVIEAREAGSGLTRSWGSFQVRGSQYNLDNLQVIDNYRKIEITGSDGLLLADL